MADCQACQLPAVPEQLPAVPEPDSHAFLWLPHGDTVSKVAHYLAERQYDHVIADDRSHIRITGTDPNKFVTQLTGWLSQPEQNDSRLLFSRTAEPGIAAFGQIMTVAAMGSQMQGQWLISLLKNRHYYSVAQPIVQARDGSVYGYEFLFRGVEEDGTPISPGRIFESATNPRVLFNLDRCARLSAVETASACLIDEKIFINFLPGSIYDPSVCLRTTVNAIDQLGIDAHRVVFEIVESDKLDDLVHLNGIIRFYRSAGFSIALDDFGTGFNNIGTFLGLQPDYIKLDKWIVRQVTDDNKMADIVRGFITESGKVGCKVLAEGVEDAVSRRCMHDLGVDLMQGYLFGKPDRLPPKVVTAARHEQPILL